MSVLHRMTSVKYRSSTHSAPVRNDTLAPANGLTAAVFWLTDKPRNSADSCSVSVSVGSYKTVQVQILILNCTWFKPPFNIEKSWLTLSDVCRGKSTSTSAACCNCCTSCTVVSRCTRMESIDCFCSAAISCTCVHRAACLVLMADRFSSSFTGFSCGHENVSHIDLTECWLHSLHGRSSEIYYIHCSIAFCG